MIVARIGAPERASEETNVATILNRLTRKILEAANYFECHPSRTGKGKEQFDVISRGADPSAHDKMVANRVANHFKLNSNTAQKQALIETIKRSSPSINQSDASKRAKDILVTLTPTPTLTLTLTLTLTPTPTLTLTLTLTPNPNSQP